MEQVRMRVAFANPKAHRIFTIFLIVSAVLCLASLAFAFLFGGGFWWGFITSFAGGIIIYALAEVSGANDEVLVPEAAHED